MVFGVFDLIHEGHRHFLREAKKFGRQLIAVAASDASVIKLKGFIPVHPLSDRVNNLEAEMLADKILKGDDDLGSWRILKNHTPDVIALGYDQKNLAESLKGFIAKNKLQIKLVSIGPHVDKSLHSSTLRKKI